MGKVAAVVPASSAKSKQSSRLVDLRRGWAAIEVVQVGHQDEALDPCG